MDDTQFGDLDERIYGSGVDVDVCDVSLVGAKCLVSLRDTSATFKHLEKRRAFTS